MIYTPLTICAMRIAYDAHSGQRDKAGTPYVFHPYHLAEKMTDEASTCVALLHDVLEDTEVTEHELSRIFPPEIMDALRCLTRKNGVDYFDYIRNVRMNYIARIVKIEDIKHNMDTTRFIEREEAEKKMGRLLDRYRKALDILSQ